LEIDGRVQKEGAILHLIAGTITDRSAWIGQLTGESPQLPGVARADEVARPMPGSRHPRRTRAMPGSRDFK
jgi:hypothetical protein